MPHAPSDLLSRRHASIRASMADAGLDALVVFALPGGLAAIPARLRRRLVNGADND